MDDRAFLDNAMRRINHALVETSKKLNAFTNEKVQWSVEPMNDAHTVSLHVQIGDRQRMSRVFDSFYISGLTAEELNNQVCKFYWEYIDSFPDLLQHKFAALLYAKVARLCGARCDVVHQFSIRREDNDSTTYIVTLRNYKAGLIQQAFSGLLIKNDAAMDIVHRTIMRMIRTLEDWPNVE